MALYYVQNTDGSAPALSGTAGALIGVLDFALVTTAGWEKVYSGTNKAVYRAPTGNRFYLRVDDSAATSARIVSYETMSDVDTGTGPCPTAAQLSGGVYWEKSDTASASARPWFMLIKDGFFHLCIGANGSTPSTWSTYGQWFCYGDFSSNKTGDAYGTFIMGNITATIYATLSSELVAGLASVSNGHFLQRDYTSTGGSKTAAKLCQNTISGSITMGDSGQTYPHPVTGGMLASQVYLSEGALAVGVRGKLLGVWNPMHLLTFGASDTFTGSGAGAGKSFRVLKHNSTRFIVFETSDTWS